MMTPKPPFGSKAWFQITPAPEVSREERDTFLQDRRNLCEDLAAINEEDMRNAYEAYRRVQSSVRVAYFHRKSERLILEDQLIKNMRYKYNKAFTEQKTSLAPLPDNATEQEKLENEIVTMLLRGEITNDEETLSGAAESISAHLIFTKFDRSIPTRFPVRNPASSPLYDGRLYQPIEVHNWLINLSWMLAHLHKGNRFLICSDVSMEYLHRDTPGYKTQISGFAREIAVALKLGYQFRRAEDHEDHMELIHDNPSKLADLSLLDITMSDDDYTTYYQRAVHQFETARRRMLSPSSDEHDETPAAKRPKPSL